MKCPECKESIPPKNVEFVIVQFRYDKETKEVIADGKDRYLCPHCGFQQDVYICRKCGRDQYEVKLKTEMGGRGYTCTDCIVKKIESKMCPNCFNINSELEQYFLIDNKISVKCLNCGHVR